MCFPFFSIFMITIVSVMFPYECPVFNILLEYRDLLLLFFMSYMFFVSGVKWSSYLSYVLHWTAHAFHLVFKIEIEKKKKKGKTPKHIRKISHTQN
jgi:hypothetical protein